ncbi:MAG: protein kinase [Candidatus Acidiferrales bacterium]
MALSSGTKLGPYEIVAPLGAGGMGEVYRARDARLGRDVALKVLPEAFAADVERMARFRREAQVLASLNHTNIAAIYGFEDSSHVHALVMELVEGPTLADRIQRGAIPPDEALPIAKQICEAIEYAHERGIVHRDLKPANIKLGNNDAVKILDFGLAKALESDPASVDISSSPTISRMATQAGIILGTAAYMSPEQAKGKTVDRRTDIWAFGCVLYEMLTRKMAFSGETVTDTLAAVIRSEPDLSLLPSATPQRIRELLQRCLKKDSRQRLQAIGDARIAIEEVLSGATKDSSASAAPAAAKSDSRKRLEALIAAVILLSIGGAGGWLFSRSLGQGSPPRFQQLTFDRGLVYAARFAPDGQSIYYSASWRGQPIQLYSTNASSSGSRTLNLINSSLFALTSSEMAISIGCKDYLIGDCGGTLAVAPISGGAPREIENDILAADWSPDGGEMAAVRNANGKFQVEFPLGKVIYRNERWIDFLRISPRGDAIAFVQYAIGGGDAGWAVIVDREGKQIARTSVEFSSVEGLAWPPGGNEVWFGATASHAWADAIHALSLSGNERIVLRLPGMLRLHDISRNGKILLSKEMWRTGMQFHGSKDASERDLSWLDSTVVTDLSADGQNVAFFEYGQGAGSSTVAYVRKTDGSPAVKLGAGYLAALSPDGKWVLVTDVGPPRLLLLPTGVGEAKILEEDGLQQFSMMGWMPDGKDVYFAGNDGHEWRMYVQDLEGGKARAFTPAILVNPKEYAYGLVAPDGRDCFARDLNGRGWLYPMAGGEAKAVAGVLPEETWVNWSADGRSAYVYQDKKDDAEVFRVDVTTGKRQQVAKLGPGDPAGLVGIEPVRVTPDGRAYAYSYNRSLSDLYVVDGVK